MAVSALSSTSSQTLIEQMKERRAALKAMEDAVRSGDIASAQQSLATLKSSNSTGTGGASGDKSNPFRTTMKTDLSSLTAAVEKGDLEGAQSALNTLDADKAKFRPPPLPPMQGDDDTQADGQGGFLGDLKSLLQAVQSGDSDGVKTALSSLQNDLQNFLTQSDAQSGEATADTAAAGTTSTSNSFVDSIKALMDAAQSGDTKGMQDAAKNVAQGIDAAITSARPHHGHHHHAATAATDAAAPDASADPSQSGVNDPTQPPPESSMLRNAREAYALLMSFGEGETA